jgi:ferredoxin
LLYLLALCVASFPAPTEPDPLTSPSTDEKRPIARRSSNSQSGSGGRAQKLGVQLNATGYTSSRVCGTCHVDIYNSWKNSLHAFSLSDPIFDAAYMQAIKEQGEEAKRVCLRCHAPITLSNADYDLELGVTREGVSCDFCHTVTAVHLDDSAKPYTTEPGLVKRSSLRRAASPSHEVAYSELHASADFCGGCHNFVNAHGVQVMSTYDEWRRGPYSSEGTQCQNCHMVLSEGKVVSEEVKNSRDEIHLHSLIHDSRQLRSALTVEIDRAERTARGFEVDVMVKNVGSGHMVPTGMPTREVVLTLTVKGSQRQWNAERRYRKTVTDAKGRTLVQDYEILLHGARIVSDNRIAPREERLERFHFIVPEGSMTVTAKVTYEYSPLLLQQRRMEIELGRAERVVF